MDTAQQHTTHSFLDTPSDIPSVSVLTSVLALLLTLAHARSCVSMPAPWSGGGYQEKRRDINDLELMCVCYVWADVSAVCGARLYRLVLWRAMPRSVYAAFSQAASRVKVDGSP